MSSENGKAPECGDRDESVGDAIERLNRIINALMDRAERSMGGQGSEFGMFQTALLLEETVQQRTRELEAALRENEAIARDLTRVNEQMQQEIQEREQAEALHRGQYRILDMIAANRPYQEVLLQLAIWMESEQVRGTVSILVLDEAAYQIADSIAPSLPQAYSQALIGLPIGPSVGSCGTAMHRKEPVFVTDIANDPLWADYQELAAQSGLYACWSTPILTTQGNVLGSFAIYNHDAHEPTETEQSLVSSAVHLAGIAIQRHRDEARIRHMAHHDSLTGLPNRVLLQDRIQRAIQTARRSGMRTAVLMVDLDRFKHINDSLGHYVGDRILQEAAERLACCVRASDTIARVGGDEFVINITELKESGTVSVVARHVLSQLERPFIAGGHSYQLGASIGVSLYPDNGRDVHDLLRAADAAMYEAKRQGRGDYRYFTEELNTAAHERMTLVSQLQQAIARKEFVLHYQPLIDLENGQLIGAEALLRWQHPIRGLLNPGQFIQLLEEHGLMADVGGWVLETACAQNALWQSQGMPAIPVSVNIAVDQFYRADLAEKVRNTLTQTGLSSDFLVLEFTESVLLKETESVLSAMRRLRAMGVGLALDDFGTGYSSLSYLHRFPVNQLKIDRSFVEGIDDEKEPKSIIRSILHLAEELGLKTVTEGLETLEQQVFVESLGCNMGQGFYFGRPMPAEAFSELFQDAPGPALSEDP